MRRRSGLLTLSILLFWSAWLAWTSAKAAKNDVTVAAAANLNEVFQVIGPAFEKASGIHPIFSFGSTAQLTQQIENGAPWDVIAAADSTHVEQLEREGKLAPKSRALYATGILALWIPKATSAPAGLEMLTNPAFKIVALANPDLAPYGLAARETLQSAGVWEKVQPKVVYADNINMAKQYGVTGNADAVFTAYSLVLKQDGKVIQIEEKLHKPIAQALGILAASRNQDAARKFTRFLLNGEGHAILLQSGYR